MYKVAVTDHIFDDLNIYRGILEDEETKVFEYQCTTEDEVIEAAHDADAILTTNYQYYTKRVIDALKKCKVIVRTGIGVDSVDIEAATEKGIMVVNVPDYCLEEVSDHAVSLMMTLYRKIFDADRELRRSLVYQPLKLRKIKSLRDCTVGIIGMGRIGRLSAKKTAPFGCALQFYDPYVTKDIENEDFCASKTSFEELMRTSDYIFVHAPATKENYHLLGKAAFDIAEKEPYIINVGRGELIDSAALAKAIEQGKISGAGLDVCEKADPFDPSDPILHAKNVILTPHFAWYSERALLNLQTTAAQEAKRALLGQMPKSLVNKQVLEK